MSLLRPLAVAAAAAAAAAAPPSPGALAESVIRAYTALPLDAGLKMATLPDYGPSICLSAMYDCAEKFGAPAWAAWASSLQDAYSADAKSNAWAVLHNVSVAWGYSVGDDMGLFPIAYLSRALASRVPWGVGDDWELSVRVAEQYVLGWPLRLPDGTMSRHGGWGTEPDVNASFLWNDDQFMGIALLARLARAPGAPAATARRYVDAIAAQHLAFAGYLQDAATGLYKHGYNHATGHRSCCSWGRANGACAACTRRTPAYRPARPPLPSCSSPPRAQAG